MILFSTRSIWLDWYEAHRRHKHESARESAVYDKLKEGPVFQEIISPTTIPRKALVKEIRLLITSTKEVCLYPLIIGEHGTGKTSLIQLAVNGIDKPKGVVYVDIPLQCKKEDDVVGVMKKGLGWSSDRVIDDPSNRNYSDPLPVDII
jgi:hypothetical protein